MLSHFTKDSCFYIFCWNKCQKLRLKIHLVFQVKSDKTIFKSSIKSLLAVLFLTKNIWVSFDHQTSGISANLFLAISSKRERNLILRIWNSKIQTTLSTFSPKNKVTSNFAFIWKVVNSIKYFKMTEIISIWRYIKST